MLHGSINHVSVTVSDLDVAMRFFAPLLAFLGFEVGKIQHYAPAGTRLTVNLNEVNGVAFNVWEAKPRLREHRFQLYQPGLHHVAFNVARHAQVDELTKLIPQIGGRLLEGPGEYPFGAGGYYAVYFTGPDGMKFEVVHMPAAEARARRLGQL